MILESLGRKSSVVAHSYLGMELPRSTYPGFRQESRVLCSDRHGFAPCASRVAAIKAARKAFHLTGRSPIEIPLNPAEGGGRCPPLCRPLGAKIYPT